jgi:hypothetical protein
MAAAQVTARTLHEPTKDRVAHPAKRICRLMFFPHAAWGISLSEIQPDYAYPIYSVG